MDVELDVYGEIRRIGVGHGERTFEMQVFFTIAYFAAIVAEVIVRAPYERQRRRIEKKDRRITAAEGVVLAGIFMATLLLPLLYAFSPWLDFADYRLPMGARSGAGGFGLVFLGMAIWLFRRSHRDLGANWSPSLEIGTQQTLVTRGVYSTIRHPMYTSQLLWGIAQTLLLQNWIAGPAGLVAFLLLYLVRVPKEERMMLDHFGDEYRAYRARTGQILPPVRRKSHL